MARVTYAWRKRIRNQHAGSRNVWVSCSGQGKSAWNGGIARVARPGPRHPPSAPRVRLQSSVPACHAVNGGPYEAVNVLYSNCSWRWPSSAALRCQPWRREPPLAGRVADARRLGARPWARPFQGRHAPEGRRLGARVGPGRTEPSVLSVLWTRVSLLWIRVSVSLWLWLWVPVRIRLWTQLLLRLPLYSGFYPYVYGGYPYPSAYPYGYAAYGYPASPYGEVKIQGAARDAQVFVDNYYAGVVDDFDGAFQHLNLVPGTHQIEIRRPGAAPLSFDVRIDTGRSITYHATAEP